MPFRDPVDGLRDIGDAIDMIERFTEGMDFEAFREDPKTVAAVERKLLVISEAAIRLGDQGPALCPDQPWHKIRGTGNWIRHQLRTDQPFGHLAHGNRRPAATQSRCHSCVDAAPVMSKIDLLHMDWFCRVWRNSVREGNAMDCLL